jgi:hypothetical protein
VGVPRKDWPKAENGEIEAMLLDHHKLLERGYRAALSEWEAQNDKERVEG